MIVVLLNLSEGASQDKPTITTKVPIQIEVRSKEEMTSYLLQGSSSRATKSTGMNNQSSRSHAIFTIYMEQKKIISCMKSEDIDIMQTKFHLVDLAGSECVKRSGVYGERLKEATSINSGLLVLGKVIDALCKKAQGKKVLHIPYRESKLISLLKDSLGGSSRTVMISCVSPTNTNINETLSTLDHAYRARSIQNKAIRNPDPMSSKRQKRESELEQLQLQLKDKDRKIKDLEEKVKKMEEPMTRMHHGRRFRSHGTLRFPILRTSSHELHQILHLVPVQGSLLVERHDVSVIPWDENVGRLANVSLGDVT